MNGDTSAGEIEQKFERIKRRQYIMTSILSIIGSIVAFESLSGNSAIVIGLLFLVIAIITIIAFWHTDASESSGMEVS